MITLEDVLGELLGGVPDEFKAPRLLPLRLTDGRVRLPGDLPLDQARVWVEDAWPAEGERSGRLSAAPPAACPSPATSSTSRDCTSKSKASRTIASARSSCSREDGKAEDAG